MSAIKKYLIQHFFKIRALSILVIMWTDFDELLTKYSTGFEKKQLKIFKKILGNLTSLPNICYYQLVWHLACWQKLIFMQNF